MTTTPDHTRNQAVLHFEENVPPENIEFRPVCKTCNGPLRFDYYCGDLAYRHIDQKARCYEQT